eukprot:s1225_g12.t1
MKSQDSQPAKRPKGVHSAKGKGGGKGKGKTRAKDEEADMQTALQTLGKLVLRLDLQMRQQNLNCCLICFTNNREESILPTLIQTTAEWKQLAGQGKVQKTLRSTLWETIITCLSQRVQILHNAKEGDELLTKAKSVGFILPDGTWPYQEWNPHHKKLVQSAKLPRIMAAMLANLTALEDSSKDPSLVTSFHSMKQMPLDVKMEDQKSLEVYPWRLQLCPREDDPWNILLQLQGNTVWNLIGLRYKQANLKPSSLAAQLGSQLKALK